MKIGLLTQEYHLGEDRFGGVGRAFGKMANWLAEQGHEVTVYLQGRRDEVITERERLRVVRVAPRSRVHWRLQPFVRRLPSAIGGWMWHREVDESLSERIMSDYRDGNIEVLLASRGITAPDLIIDRKLPTVIRMQYSLIRKQRVERQSIRLLDRYHDAVEKRAIRRADRVYVTCRFTKDYAATITRRNIDIIRTPMFELDQAAAWESVQAKYRLPKKFYLFWGGLIRVKGVDALADALPRVFERDSDSRMVIVGSRRYEIPHGGTTADSILGVAKKHPDRMVLVPSIDPPELFAIIKHAHVVVLPSIMDNFPNALLEAMYFGKTIVASRGASMNELIEDGRDGLLFPPGDGVALAETMIRAAKMSTSEREQLGKAAAARVRAECAPDVVMSRVVELCSSAIKNFRISAASI